MNTLGDELPREIDRNRELVKIYRSIGPVGEFGARLIEADIAAAEKATAEGDVAKMLIAYNSLKNNKS